MTAPAGPYIGRHADRITYAHENAAFAFQHARTVRHQQLADLRELIHVLAGLMASGKRTR